MIFVNDELVQYDQYPNGETVVPTFKFAGVINPDVRMRLHWTGDHDLTHLALLKGLFDQMNSRVILTIDYMPYSRMDREQDGHCFSLKYVAALINAMGFTRVYVVEPHSDVTLKLLERSTPIWATAKLTPVAMHMMNFDKAADYLVLPDDGAFKRYSEQIPELNECNVIILKKKRDFETGAIQGLEVDRRILKGYNTEDAEFPQGLILDDLSSRGGTFVAAADILRNELGLGYIALLVTHMEPVGLTGNLRTKLNRVYCTDTMEMPRPLPDNFELLHRSQWQ